MRSGLAVWVIGGAVLLGVLILSATAGIGFIPELIGGAVAIAVILLLIGSPIFVGYLVYRGFQRWRTRSRA